MIYTRACTASHCSSKVALKQQRSSSSRTHRVTANLPSSCPSSATLCCSRQISAPARLLPHNANIRPPYDHDHICSDRRDEGRLLPRARVRARTNAHTRTKLARNWRAEAPSPARTDVGTCSRPAPAPLSSPSCSVCFYSCAHSVC